MDARSASSSSVGTYSGSSRGASGGSDAETASEESAISLFFSFSASGMSASCTCSVSSEAAALSAGTEETVSSAPQAETPKSIKAVIRFNGHLPFFFFRYHIKSFFIAQFYFFSVHFQNGMKKSDNSQIGN